MRLFTATLAHETSPFSPIPTSLQSFRRGLLHRPSRGEIVDGRLEAIECGLTAQAQKRGHDVVEGLGAAATPSGLLIQADYEAMRDEILDDLRKAMPVDAVALFLHGAQMAHGYDDCEGDLLSRVRALVGPDIPVGVEFDLHGNVTQAMVDAATFLVACREYPHTDFPERAAELLDLLERTVAGDIHPVTVMRRVPVLGIFHTTREPMKSFVAGMKAREAAPEVLSISAAHGFPWADTTHAGAAIIVTTNGDLPLAETNAEALADAFFEIRAEAGVPVTSVDAALDEAQQSHTGLTVVADTADNAGGGAAGDSTYMLQALLDRGIGKGAAIGMIWDPQAVALAFDAGEGGALTLRIGGKTSALSGMPIDLDVTVRALTENGRQIAFGTEQPLGRMARVETAGGLSIVLGSYREQVHSPEAFLSVGLDPAMLKLLVVKSAQHFHARFQPIAERILYAVAPGVTSVDFRTFAYRHLQRPIWPLDPITHRNGVAA